MSSESMQVWREIKLEARKLVECEPILASFFHSTLLNHEYLGNALSYILANKLASATMPAISVREIIEDAIRSDDNIAECAARDILAVRQRDPAVDKYSTPLLYLKASTRYRPIALGTGCGIRTVKHWQSTCKIRCLWYSALIFTLRLVLVTASCLTMPPVLLLVKRPLLKTTFLSSSQSRWGNR